MNLLAMDSPLMRFFARVGDIILLNLIFVVTSLPMVTIGASLSALYAVAMKLVRGEEPSVWKEYLKAWKGNFKTATLCWLIMTAAAGLLVLDFRLAGAFAEAAYTAVRLVLAMALGIWMLIFLYLFPYIARFENTVFHSIKNALLLNGAHLPSSLMMLGISLGFLVLTFYTSETFVIGTVLWTFAGFALMAWVQSFLLCRVFANYEK